MAQVKRDIKELSAAKRQLLAKLMQEKTKNASEKIPLVKRKNGDKAPLSFSQRQLWFMEQLEQDNPFYNVPTAYRLDIELDIAAMEYALNRILERHEILRTYIAVENGEPFQVVDPCFQIPLRFRDLREAGRPGADNQAIAMMEEEARTPFHLSSPPIRVLILQLTPQSFILVLNIHHIAFDGWSMPIFVRELLHYYRPHAMAKASPLPQLEFQYSDFAIWQKQRQQEGDFEGQYKYWCDALASAAEPLDLPTDRLRPPVQSFRGGCIRDLFPRAMLERLRSQARANDVTSFMLVFSAFVVLLKRYSGKDDIPVGTIAANRTRPQLEDLIGYFANTLVLRIDTSANPVFKELLRRVGKVTLDANSNQELPLGTIVQRIQPNRDPSRNPLFEVMFVYQNEPPQVGDSKDQTVTRIDLHNETAKFDIDISLTETPGGIAVQLEYNSDIFMEETPRRMLRHFLNILEHVATTVNTPVLNIPLLADDERKRILYEWNRSAIDFPQQQCLHRLFEEQAARDADAPAVYHNDRMMTRGELNRKSDNLARLLQEAGIRPNIPAAICVQRSFEMVVGMMGILKAGGAYLPIDPSYPQHRISFMMEDACATVILTQQHLVPRLPRTSARVICLDNRRQDLPPADGAGFSTDVGPGDLAYVIYTSGTTGNPKGVMLDHRGRVNNFMDFNRRFSVGIEDRLLAISSLSFDMCAYDVFGTLACGAAIVLPGPELERQPSHWAELMTRYRVTIWHSVPAMLEVLVEYVAQHQALIPDKCRLILLGGDWIPVSLPTHFKQIVPNAVVVSLGGATEVSMDSIIYIVDAVDPQWKSIPYGVPMYNQLAYILDAMGEPVPIGVPGELYIGGIGVGWGYCNRPQLTSEKFAPNPWGSTSREKMYQTGDMARFHPDGVIQLLGRMDSQVKIRGYRIEPGEIESALRGYPLIDIALVAARQNPSGGRELVAYIVLKPGAAKPTAADFRNFLKDRLPEYFVPAHFVVLEKLPLTANGKVDRRSLPAPESASGCAETVSRPHEAPRTEAAKKLAEIWKDLLGVPDVSVNDGFFSLGGDSITSIRMITRAREAGINITVKQVFLHQTIAALVEAAESGDTAGVEFIPFSAHQYLLFAEGISHEIMQVQQVLLEVPAGPGPEGYREILINLVQRYDAFKLRFRLVREGWRQLFNRSASAALLFKHIAMTEETGTENLMGNFMEKVSAQFRSALNLLDGPVICAGLFTGQEGVPVRLLLSAPRLVIAEPSWGLLLEHLALELEGLLQQRAAPGNPGHSSIRWGTGTGAAVCQGPGNFEKFVKEKSVNLANKGVSFKFLSQPIDPGLNSRILDLLGDLLPLKLRDIAAAALECALRRTGRTGNIRLDVLHSYANINHNPLPLGCHGDFFRLTIDAEPCDSLLEILQRSRAYFAGQESIAAAETANQPDAVLLEVIDPPLKTDIPGSPLKRLHFGDDNAEIPVGTNGLQVKVWCIDRQFRCNFFYHPNVWDHSSILDLYSLFSQYLADIVGLCAEAGRSILRPFDFPDAQLLPGQLNELLEQENPVDIFPLGPMQAQMVEQWQKSFFPGLYVIQSVFPLPGSIDVEVFRQTWAALVQRHEVFRSFYLLKETKQPLQVIRKSIPLPFTREDWRDKSLSEQESALELLIRQQRAMGFDLEKGPLFRLYLLRLRDDMQLFLQFNFYTILDGWSFHVLQKDMVSLYQSFANGAAPALGAHYPYRSYVQWAANQDFSEARSFWTETLAGIKKPALLSQAPQVRPNPTSIDTPGPGFKRYILELGQSVVRAIEQMCRENALTFTSVVMAGWSIVLRNRLGSQDIVFGVTTSGRPPACAYMESIVGLFINTIPIRVLFDNQQSMIENIRNLQTLRSDTVRFESLPLKEICNCCGLAPGQLLFDTILVFDNYPVNKDLHQADVIYDHPLAQKNFNLAQTEFPLRVDTWRDQTTSLVFSYYSHLFPDDIIVEISADLEEALRTIVEVPGEPAKNKLKREYHE